MIAYCDCGRELRLGTDYPKLLALAEAGKLEKECLGGCGHLWKPKPDGQKLYASNIRKMMAEDAAFEGHASSEVNH